MMKTRDEQRKRMGNAGIFLGICFVLLIGVGHAYAAEVRWSDYRKPLTNIRALQHGRAAIEGATITVKLPQAFLNKHRDIVLKVTIESRTSGGFEAYRPFIQVNKAIFKTYNIPAKDLPTTQTHRVSIEKKDLKAGDNILHFTFRWNSSNTYCSGTGCGYTIKSVAFQDAVLPTPTPTPTRTPTPTPTRTPKPRSTPTPSPVPGLLKQADEYFEKKWFLTPEESNAFDTYREVLRLESGNAHAREKLREIMRQYAIWGENNAKEGEYDKARSYYERGLTVGKFLVEELRDENVANAYQDLQQQLDVVTNPPTPTPMPSGYTLSIYSTPAGAMVYLGDTFKGTTPVTLNDVEEGFWMLRLEKSGYRSYETKLFLSSSMPRRLSYSYTLHQVYTLSISSNPAGAMVYLDDTFKGSTPVTLSDIEEGFRALRLEKSGYRSYETKLFLSSSMPHELSYSYTLKPNPTPTPVPTPTPSAFTLSINSIPESARVYLGNQYKGMTPLSIKFDGKGPVLVTLEKSGYRPYQTTLDFSYANSRSLSYNYRLTAFPTPTATPSPTPSPVPTPTVVEQAAAIPDEIQALMQRPGQVYAVIVGIGDYADEWIPDFRFTEHDAQAVYDTLVDPRYGAVPADNMQVLLGRDATQRAIRRAIGSWLPQRLEEGDVALIFYAGHGAFEAGGGYWVPYDAQDGEFYSTALSHRKLSEMVDRLAGHHVLLLLDASYDILTYNQQDIEMLEQAETPWEPLLRNDVSLLSASDGKALSAEREEDEHGVFTFALLNGLRDGADANADGVITFDELGTYAQAAVPELSDNHQQPQQLGAPASEFPLAFHLDHLRQKSERLRVEQHIASLRELHQAGDLSDDQLQRAVNALETGMHDQILEDFLSGNLSLELFRDIF